MISSIQGRDRIALPNRHVWQFDDPAPDGVLVEFRLMYRGKLPAETNKPRSDDKRRIRSAIHPQLLELVNTHPYFGNEMSVYSAKDVNGFPTFWDWHASQNKVVSVGNHIHSFCPIITPNNYHACSLDILFLRRDPPGNIVHFGGDVDNRLKVLLDALRMPRETQEVDDLPQVENPCFCLLADDRYIDKISVTTDRLLSPMENDESVKDVVLVIHVNVRLHDKRFDFFPM